MGYRSWGLLSCRGVHVSLLEWPVMEELQRAAVHLMRLRWEWERNAGKKRRRGCKRKGCFRRDGKRGIGGKEGGGSEMGKEGGRGDCNTQAAGSAAGQWETSCAPSRPRPASVSWWPRKDASCVRLISTPPSLYAFGIVCPVCVCVSSVSVCVCVCVWGKGERTCSQNLCRIFPT